MTYIDSEELRCHPDSVFNTLHQKHCCVVRHRGRPVSVVIEQQPRDPEALITKKYQAAMDDCNDGHHLSLFVVKRSG